jgi:hypothetical protein
LTKLTKTSQERVCVYTAAPGPNSGGILPHCQKEQKNIHYKP